MNNSVYMGTNSETWMAHKKIKYITFSVTDDCNLACAYCYFTHKTNKKIMSLEVAIIGHVKGYIFDFFV